MKNIGLIFITILTFIPVNVSSQSITWERRSDIPIPISKAKASVVKGKIYIMGGVSPSFRGFSVTNFEYDPKTDSWTKKKDMPTGRTNYAMAVVENKIYLIGGDPFLNKVDVYDPESDVWDTVSRMPSKRQHVSCSVVDNKIYVIGGLEDVCCPPYPERCNWEKCAIISNKNQVYDPKTDSWKNLSPLPTPRHGLDMVSINGKIYVIGGMGDKLSMWNSLNVVEEYDPITDSWSKKQSSPIPRDGYAYSAQNNKIYLFGGWISDSQQTDSTWVYNINSDTWTNSTKTPFKTGACAYATINSKIYLFGGDKEDYTEIYSITYDGEIH